MVVRAFRNGFYARAWSANSLTVQSGDVFRSRCSIQPRVWIQEPERHPLQRVRYRGSSQRCRATVEEGVRHDAGDVGGTRGGSGAEETGMTTAEKVTGTAGVTRAARVGSTLGATATHSPTVAVDRERGDCGGSWSSSSVSRLTSRHRRRTLARILTMPIPQSKTVRVGTPRHPCFPKPPNPRPLTVSTKPQTLNPERRSRSH